MNRVLFPALVGFLAAALGACAQSGSGHGTPAQSDEPRLTIRNVSGQSIALHVEPPGYMASISGAAGPTRVAVNEGMGMAVGPGAVLTFGVNQASPAFNFKLNQWVVYIAPMSGDQPVLDSLRGFRVTGDQDAGLDVSLAGALIEVRPTRGNLSELPIAAPQPTAP